MSTKIDSTRTHIQITVSVPVKDIVDFVENGGFTILDKAKFGEFVSTNEEFKTAYNDVLVQAHRSMLFGSEGNFERNTITKWTLPEGLLVDTYCE